MKLLRPIIAPGTILCVCILLAPIPSPAQHAELISKAANPFYYGRLGNAGGEGFCQVSSDGSRIAFVSFARNLLPGDVNGRSDVFVHDRSLGQVRYASVGSDGQQANSSITSHAISGNGRYVVFATSADNLVPGVDSGSRQVFRHDLQTGQTIHVSLDEDGELVSSVNRVDGLSFNGNRVLVAATITDSSFTQLLVHDIDSQATVVASVNAQGELANASVASPARLSADGSTLAFHSQASNLADGISNGLDNLFIRDLDAQTTIRALTPASQEPDAGMFLADISADGTLVLMASAASGLTFSPPPEGGVQTVQLYVHDWIAGSFQRVSVDDFGVASNQDIVFSQAGISPGGRYVTFLTDADNLVVGDTNNDHDVFLHDRLSQTTVRLNDNTEPASFWGSTCVAGLGAAAPIVFYPSATSSLIPSPGGAGSDWMGLVIEDLPTGTTSLANLAPEPVPIWSGDRDSRDARVAGGGSHVVFKTSARNIVNSPTWFNFPQVVRRNLVTGQYDLVSQTAGGEPLASPGASNPSVSHDGSRVAFSARYDTLHDLSGDLTQPAGSPGATREQIFLRDMGTNELVTVSVNNAGELGDGDSRASDMTADGLGVAFSSNATNLVPDDTNGRMDIFYRDLVTSETTRVSLSSDGVEGNGTSSRPAVSANGRFIAFDSLASNLVNGDTNGVTDVFVHDRQTGQTIRVSVNSVGGQANGSSDTPSISANGRYVAFASRATNLDSGVINGDWNVFRHDRLTGETIHVSIPPGGDYFAVRARTPVISADGSSVLFRVDTDGPDQGLYLRRIDEGVTWQLGRSIQGEFNFPPGTPAALSPDGMQAWFYRSPVGLVGGEYNATSQIFRADLDLLFRDGFDQF